MSPYRIAVGFVIAFLIGAATRWFNVPVPAPPTFIGAFLIVAMTAGWIVTDKYLGEMQNHRVEKSKQTFQSSSDQPEQDD